MIIIIMRQGAVIAGLNGKGSTRFAAAAAAPFVSDCGINVLIAALIENRLRLPLPTLWLLLLFRRLFNAFVTMRGRW